MKSLCKLISSIRYLLFKVVAIATITDPGIYQIIRKYLATGLRFIIIIITIIFIIIVIIIDIRDQAQSLASLTGVLKNKDIS